jgi:autotransporter-associated beta strand protein
MPYRCSPIRSLALIGLLLSGGAAPAQVYWDGGGFADTWGTASNWSNNTVPGSGTDVVFDNTYVGTLPSAITLTANRSADTLTFDTADDLALTNGSGSRTLSLTSGDITRTSDSGGTQTLSFTTLALGGNSAMNIGGTGSLVINSAMTGAATLTKTGAGLLVLGGTNTFTGNVAVNAGTLSVSANANLGNAANDVSLNGGTLQSTGTFTLGANRVVTLGASGGTLDVSSGQTLTLGTNNQLTGTGALTKEGAGTVSLTATNNFTGNIALYDGTLRVASDATLGNTANDLTLNGGRLETTASMTLNANRVVTVGASGGTLDVNSGTTLTLGTAGQLTGSGAFTKADSGTLAITAANTTYTGNTTVDGGVLSLSGYNGLGTGNTSTLTLNNGSELTANWGDAATNYQGNITINDGIIRHTDVSGNKAGFQNNNPTDSQLIINGTAQLIDQGNMAGGLLTFDGRVTLNTGANVTANAVGANDEVRFGGGQNITLAAGTTLTTAGSGLVSFGSGAARTIAASGTSTQQATISLGAASNTANAGTTFQIDGAGTGGLRVEGTKAKVDGLMTDARLAATAGSGGTLTLAYTAGGSRTLGTAANLATASAVALGLESSGGTFTLGTAGGGTGDLANWGGLVVGPSTTVTFADNYVFSATDDLTLLGGTLNLNNTTQTFGTLTVSANSVIDFAGVSSTLNLSNLVIAAGVTLTINNWTDAADYFYSLGWSGATYDSYGAPMNQIKFTGFGTNNAHWREYNNEITPVPEPSTYGLLMTLGAGGFLAWRRRRRSRKSS